ncbi:MAG: hypothetical protein KIT27_11460 [Legionellales bacterium]|nr:hypothetical protein [Legionellales bacterium]
MLRERDIMNSTFTQMQPCPLCQSMVSCYNTAIISGESQSRSHYLIACTTCGYGPAQAFSTQQEASSHWNIFAENIVSKELN